MNWWKFFRGKGEEKETKEQSEAYNNEVYGKPNPTDKEVESWEEDFEIDFKIDFDDDFDDDFEDDFLEIEADDLTPITPEQLKAKFEEETGKHAVWRGALTKGYLAWKKDFFSENQEYFEV